MKLEDIEKLCEGATPGPWMFKLPNLIWFGPSFGDCTETTDNDDQFIAASREIMPELVSRVRQLEAERDKLLVVAKAARELHERVGDGDNGPPQHYWVEWNDLDEALEELEKS